MAIFDPPSLPSKIHFNGPYYVATSFLISHRDMFIITQYFESYADLKHLFLIGILPNGVSILLVRFYSILYISWDLDTKLVVLFDDPVIDRCNDTISYL